MATAGLNPVIIEDWPLVNWNAKVFFQDLPVQSPIFNIRDMVCHLYFDEKSDKEKSNEHFELILKGKSAEVPEFLSFYSKTHIVDMRQNIRFEEDNVITRTEKSFEYCIWRVNKQRLLVHRFDLVGDNEWLNLICSFGPSKENPISKKTELRLSRNFRKSTTVNIMSIDYLKLLDSGFMADVTILCKDRNVQGHRLVLSGRSKVLSEILQTGDGVIDLSDMDSVDVYPILYYLYSGKLPEINFNNMYVVYDTSHNLQLDALKMGCANYMISELTVGNSLRCLNHAQGANDTMFKLAIGAFLKFSKRFLDKEIWRKIHNQYRTVTTWNLEDETFQRNLPKITLD